jgi:hypothetical protein
MVDENRGAVGALMGFGFGVFLVGMLVWYAVSYLTSRDERAKINREFAAAPARSAFALVMALSAAGFILGIFIHPLGKIPVGVGGHSLPLWQACGIVGALCVVIDMFRRT